MKYFEYGRVVAKLFPDYKGNKDALLHNEVFIEILDEYLFCKDQILAIKLSAEEKTAYQQLEIELRAEIILFLIRTNRKNYLQEAKKKES